MTGPFDWLLPQGARNPNDPMAWLMANQQQPAGLVPDETDTGAEDIWTPTAASPRHAPLPASKPEEFPDYGAAGEATQPVNDMPEMPRSGGGAWANWVQQPGAREFLISTGLQLMTGGWGNTMSQVGQALGNGFSAMSNAQQAAAREEQQALAPEPAPRRSGRRRRSRYVDEEPPVGGTYPTRRSRGVRTAGAGLEDRQMQATREFLDSNPSPEQWEQQNGPGGLIPAVFGGPQDYRQRAQLLQFVQDRQAQAPAPGGAPAERPAELNPENLRGATWEQLIQMGASTSQGARAAFQEEAARRLGKGYEYFVNEKGEVARRRTALAPRTDQDPRNPISTPQMERQIQQLRRAFSVLVGTTNEQGELRPGEGSWMAQRGVAQVPLVGQYIAPATSEALRAVQHSIAQLTYGLSGRQVGQREQQMLMDLFRIENTDSRETMAFKLNEAYVLYNSMLQARKGGASDAQIAEMFNSALARASAEIKGGVSPGAARGPANIQANEPAVPPAPPTGVQPPIAPQGAQPGAAPQGLPPGWRQEGDEWVAPDGTRIRRSQ